MVLSVPPTPTSIATSTPTNTPTATQPSASYECSFNAYTCTDFDTQGEAQAVFDYSRARGVGDIHQLDADSDGEACESLPGRFRVIRQWLEMTDQCQFFSSATIVFPIQRIALADLSSRCLGDIPDAHLAD
jgi:hypothetical protein